MADRVRIAFAAAAMAGVALAACPAQADLASDAYDQQLAAYRNVKAVHFHDDTADVAGKAYDFTKATLKAFGVPGVILDTADFARSVKNEGAGWHNSLTYVASVIARKVPTEKFKAIIGKMKEKDLLELAERLHIGKTGELQKAVLDYLTSTAPQALEQGVDSSASDAAATVFISAMTKMCKTCGAAYYGYKLAVEAQKAVVIAFDNEETEKLFNDFDRNGIYDRQAFKDGFVGSRTEFEGARKALTALYASQNRPPPTEGQLMDFIYDRYQRWQTEIKDRQDDAATLAAVEDQYLKLAGYEKRNMFGDGAEAQWASAYMSNFMNVYRDLVSYRDDADWPPGARDGRATIEAAAADLLKRRLNDGISHEQYEYEKRKLLASCGWISPDEVGNPPPALPPKDDRASIVQRLEDRLPKLDQSKMSALFDRVGIKPSPEFYDCMCPQSDGFHYYVGPDAGGPCRRIGSLGGVSWTGFNSGNMKSCAGAHRLDDGRSVFDALADSIAGLQAAQGRR